jgi:processive 1,2-diacylglycerol beta-glucosyltransferase
MDDFRVLICYADTGGGHKSAADAIRSAVQELAAQEPTGRKVEVFVETVVGETNILNAFFVRLYNHLLRSHQDWMKYYIGFIETFKPDQSPIGYLFCKPFLKTLFATVKPSVVVSVHPMVNHYLFLGRRDAGLAGKVKMIIVLTDPNACLWSGWACKGVDLFIAPNDLAHDRLVKMGIPSSRIKTIGMPVEPAFVHPVKVTREKLLTGLGLEPDRLTILLSGGWAGGGAVVEIYEALTRVTKPIQVIILCGNNVELFDKMKILEKASPLPTVALGFSELLSDLFSAGDLLVTKAGGLTTFEAVARRLPMAIYLIPEPMPQEMGTVEILVEAGLAQSMRSTDDIIAIVENLEPVPNRETQVLPSVHNLDRVDAVYDIARIILDIDTTDLAKA